MSPTKTRRRKARVKAPMVESGQPFDAEADRLEELAFWSWLDIASRGRADQGMDG